jgi:CheY-like chemotaxis protein
MLKPKPKPQSAGHQADRRLSVLVAEDDEFLQHLTTVLLQELGHTGVIVDDGKKALACLEQRRFDLVLLDIMMPVMDGLAALAAIRRQEQGGVAHQRVIMVTGHSGANDKARLIEAGADGYVAKPLNIHQLEAELERVMRLG